jgi:hypothetical protein
MPEQTSLSVDVPVQDGKRRWASLREKPRCRDCAKVATVELFNEVNSKLGDFCPPHGRMALARYQRGDGP